MEAVKFADLARNLTTSAGTGPITLGAAATGFRSIGALGLATGDSFYYSIQGITNPTQFEVGRGTLQADGTIARTAPVGPLVDFLSGVKSIAIVTSAKWFTDANTEIGTAVANAAAALGVANAAQADADAAQADATNALANAATAQGAANAAQTSANAAGNAAAAAQVDADAAQADVDALEAIVTAQGGAIAAKLSHVADITALQALAIPADGTAVLLRDPLRGGVFRFNTADLSVLVAADTAKGLYVPPNADLDGSSGAWVRQIIGPINPQWFGVVEGANAGANGAANSSAWTAMWTILRGLAKNIFAAQQSLLPILFPLGFFEFATTIEIDNGSVIVEGVGSGSATHRGTELKFPAGQTGILVQSHDTAGASGAAANHPSSAGSIIRNLTITGGFVADEGEFHGIHLRGRINIEDCFIRNFEGDGIFSDTTTGGNANLTFIKKVTVNNCRNGFYVNGDDVNVWCSLNLDCSSNRQWGIWDSGFLGNQYFACHVSSNGFVVGNSTIGSVSHGGQRYAVIPGQEVGASTNAPTGAATDNQWWKFFGAGGASAAVPAWANGTTYRAAGSIRTDNNNAKHVFCGCYREPGQGHAQLVRPTLVMGGVLASSSVTGAGVLDVTDGGALITYNAFRAQFGTAYSQIGESSVSGTLALWNDSVVAPNSWRWKFSGNDLRLDYANNNPSIWVTGPSTPQQFGTGAAVPNAVSIVRLMVGDFAGSLANARRIQMENAVPAANAHAIGEVVWNRTPTAAGIDAWRCVGAGTPGSYVANYVNARAEPLTGVGYVTGAGGTVVQATSKSTGVTLNKVTGQITMHNAALAAGASVSFTLTNSAIAATDVPNVVIGSGASVDSYAINVTAVAAGSCRIQVRNISAGSLSEALVLNFAILRGASA